MHLLKLKVMTTDPLKRSKVLESVADAWEGQPMLSFSEFVGTLKNLGLSYATDDDEIIEMCARLTEVYPSLLPQVDGRVEGMWLATVEDAAGLAARVVLTHSHVFIHRWGHDVSPGVWKYSALRPTGPNRPLVITNTQGFEHRLGVVFGMARLIPRFTQVLPRSFSRDSLSGHKVIVELEGGKRVLLASMVHVYTPGNREVGHEKYRWESVHELAVGKPLRVALVSAGVLELNPVQEIFLADAPTAQVKSDFGNF